MTSERLLLGIVLLFGVSVNRGALARSLTDDFDAIASTQLRIKTAGHTAHFSSSALTIQGRLVGELSSSAAELPAISTAPGFTYRYDPALGTPQRVRGSLGPVFADRVETVGRHRLDVGATYTFVDFTRLNGESLDGMTALLHHAPVFESKGVPFPYVKDTITLRFNEFTLRSHVFSLFGTYGITDRWDMNALLPLFDTELRVRGRARINVSSSSVAGTHLFDNGDVQKDVDVDGEKFGVGDLLLRTKYRLLTNGFVRIAPVLTVRIPTGNRDDFQGLGDVTVTPALILSREIRHHDLHLNLGIEANTGDLDRSRGRYAAGVTFGLTERIAVPIDLVGSSGLTDQRVSRSVPVFGTTPAASGMVVGSKEVGLALRTDQVDLAVGIKVNPVSRLIAFASAIVPLTSDGLRADVIPVCGAEWRF